MFWRGARTDVHHNLKCLLILHMCNVSTLDWVFSWNLKCIKISFVVHNVLSNSSISHNALNILLKIALWCVSGLSVTQPQPCPSSEEVFLLSPFFTFLRLPQIFPFIVLCCCPLWQNVAAPFSLQSAHINNKITACSQLPWQAIILRLKSCKELDGKWMLWRI